MKTTNPALDLYSVDETERFMEKIVANNPSSKSDMIEDKRKQKANGVTTLKILRKNRNLNASSILVKRNVGERVNE